MRNSRKFFFIYINFSKFWVDIIINNQRWLLIIRSFIEFSELGMVQEKTFLTNNPGLKVGKIYKWM